MVLSRRSFLAVPALTWLANAASARADQPVRNVVLVTTDGLRWQEVFRGADDALLNTKPGGVVNVDALRNEFVRDTAEARREALLPFLWGVLARKGQLFGNADVGSIARVTNGKNFSYPGYNEILSGLADPRINSNDKRPNPNVNVFEWLSREPDFAGRVAAFGAWDVFPYIFNTQRSGVPVTAGWDPIRASDLSERERLLNDLLASTHPIWDGECYDSFTFEAAMEHLRRRRPRAMFIGFGETDEFAHEGRYDHYLHAAHRYDASLRRLWETIQSMPEYRDQTALVVTTDHGRGDSTSTWRDHGANVPGSDLIWLGFLGPTTPALGVRTQVAPVAQAQIAATLAALVGEDYRADFPKAGPALPDVIQTDQP